MQTHNGGLECPEAERAASAQSRFDASDPFCADLRNGLHALAQPLSVLRAASEVLAMPAIQGVDQRRYLEIWCAQVERACDLFGNVQDLVATRIIEAAQDRFDLWELLAPMIDDQRALLHSSGVGIALANAVEWVSIRGDAERTAHALTAVLKMAGSVASRGDVIELYASRLPGFMQIRFQNTRRHGRKMSSSDRLRLALAAANITTQHGSYDFAEDPFCFSVSLPLDDQEPSRNRTASCTDRTH